MKRTPASTSGFTLVELLIVVTVVGILAVIAIPEFSYLTKSQRAKNASFEVYSLVSRARSEAIRRNHRVSVVPVMVGGVLDRIDVADTDAGVLLYTKAKPKGVVIIPSVSTGIVFLRSGRTSAASTGATFQIVAEGDTTAAHTRCITMGLSGMPQTRKGIC